MKKTGLLLTFLVITTFVYGYDSGIALVTEKGMNMQVFVNGKLYNKNPGKFVRVHTALRASRGRRRLNDWLRQ